MTIRNAITAGAAALILASSASLAMAQATSKENNATSGSTADMEMKGESGKMKHSSGSMEMKSDKPTSAGSEQNPSKDLRGHSETPTTGK